MTHSAKRVKRKRLAQEAQRKYIPRPAHQIDPMDLSEPGTVREEEDDHEILFPPRVRESEETIPSPTRARATTDCDIVNMVKTLNGAIAAVSQDTARVQWAYQQLCTEDMARDKALADLTAMVKEYSSSLEATRPYGPSPITTRPHPTIQADVMDGEGNLRAADIGITWEGNETFLHGVRVVGPHSPRPAGPGPIMSTPYPREREDDRSNSSTTAQPPTPVTPVLVLDMDVHVCLILLGKCVRDIDRLHLSKGSTTNPSTGRCGFVISGRSLTSMAGTRNRERYNWCPTSTKSP